MTRTADTRHDLDRSLRRQTRGAAWPRGRRRALALGYLAAVGLAAAGAVLPGTGGRGATAVGVLAAVASFVLLRRATRLVADAPDDALDELLVRLRGECFVAAYQALAAVACLVGGVLLVGGANGLGAAAAAVCGLSLLGLALGLPLVLTALTLPDVERPVITSG